MTKLSEHSGIRSVYLLPRDNLLEELVDPALRICESYDVLAGFFSSSILREMAPSLAAFLTKPDRRMRLVCSPVLSTKDSEADAKSVEWASADLAAELGEILGSTEITESALAQYTLKCLSYLLKVGQIQIKFATTWCYHSSEQFIHTA